MGKETKETTNSSNSVFVYHPLYLVCLYFVKFLKFVERIIFKFFRERTKLAVIKEFKDAGIEVDGSDPWDFKVLDEDFYVSAANSSNLALGEFYMHGGTYCKDIEASARKVLQSKMINNYFSRNPLNKLYYYVTYNMFNLQTKSLSKSVADMHYDMGNDLFESFLDPYMQYTCAYWKNATTLEDAQLHKMDLIARKLKLKPGMKVLDMGCGWGGLSKYMAEKYGVSVVGVNIAKEGVKYGQKLNEGLPVDIRLQDYRDINEKFDRIAAIGLMEHVGESNYKEFFQVAERCLKDDGLFLMHTIGLNSEIPNVDPWLLKYIFPNGMIPRAAHIPKYSEGSFIIEDWHNFGSDYELTLHEWNKRFNEAWPKLKNQNRDEVFYRMMNYYFKICAAAFNVRLFQLWQCVFSKNGIKGGYQSVR